MIGIVDLAVVNLLFDVLARLNWFVRGFIAIAMLGPLAFSMDLPRQPFPRQNLKTGKKGGRYGIVDKL